MFYDPMIAKVIGYGDSREAAIAALSETLDRLHVDGLQSNAPFLSAVLLLAAPANAFVHHLLGADDPYRHFERLSVKQALQPAVAIDGTETEVDSRVREEQSLNDALQGILQGSTDYVLVEDSRQRIIGRVTLASLQRIRRSLNGLLNKEHLPQ